MRRSLVLLVVLAAGCFRGGGVPEETAPRPSIAAQERPPEPWPARGRTFTPPRENDRCRRVTDHLFDIVRRDAGNAGITAAMVDEMHAAGLESCQETAWSEELLTCSELATSLAQVVECLRTMTTEQREDFDRRLTDIRLRHRNAIAPSPPPP
jgi:hypothetical protein